MKRCAATPRVDYVDVCTFPDFRLEPIEICAQTGKHVQVQKPIATNLETARRMIETARRGGHPAGRGEPAPLRRRQPVPLQGDRRPAAWASCSSATAT